MRDLAAIRALYLEIDADLDDRQHDEEAAGRLDNAERIAAKRRLNNQAYFLLCWGQIESAIDDGCRRAIQHHRDLADWRQRRAWTLYNPDDRRLSGLSFEDRARLVLREPGAHRSPFALAMTYYAIRNEIAHGRSRSAAIDVVAAIADFYAIHSAVEP